MENLRKQAMSKAALSSSLLSSQGGPSTSSMGPPPPPPPMQGQTPLIPTWTSYWDENESIFIPDRGYFNYYASGKEGDPVVLFVHGGGYTGLTWSLVAKKLKGKGLRLLAPDLRGHGLTRSDEEEDFSKETLSQDVAALWEHLVVQPHNRRITGSSSESSVSSEEFCGILVGHSMGAALSVWAALGPLQPDPNLSQVEGEKGEGQPSVPQNDASTSSSSTTLSNSSSAWATPAPASYPGRIASGAATEPGVKAVRLKGLGGLIMIDVVEGTAIAALPFMVGVISNRPSSFRSIQEAIAWCGRTGQCKSKEAASISLPSQLIQSEIEVEVDHGGGSREDKAGLGPGVSRPPRPGAAMPIIGEDEEEGGEGIEVGGADEAIDGKDASSAGQAVEEKEVVRESVWTWRTPLLKSQPHWTSWYKGLSDAFLSLPCPKMLMLAGADRLDKELTIGQMQGKFQLAMMPNAGHAIQEDEAGKVAEAITQFVQRFRIGLPAMVIPKAPSGTERVLPIAIGMPFKPS